MAGLDSIEHIVLVMLENRSFDQMLGFLCPKSDNFTGLDGTESNPDATGTGVKVFKITPGTPHAYYYPLANPAEGYCATNDQLFGSYIPPATGEALNDGFVTSFAKNLQNLGSREAELEGATPASIMGMYAPETLPVLSGLARGFAVSDGWFASVPTQTFPNRAFVGAGTSLGDISNVRGRTLLWNTPSVFGKLADLGKTWKIYGYSGIPVTTGDFPDSKTGPYGEVVPDQPGIDGGFARFQADAANGKLAAFSFIEPQWAPYNDVVQNDQHPPSDVAAGEKLLYDVYQAVRSNSQAWEKTLLIITYDEHGGNYDHVHPPTGATAPDNNISPDPGCGQPFDFTRFGVRVPTVIVSPLIPEGTIFRAPTEGPPFDHTSIIATLRARFGIAALGKRDAAAPHIGPGGPERAQASVLTLPTPRTDDPLDGIKPPTAPVPVVKPGSREVGFAPSSFLEAHAVAAAALPVPTDRIAEPEAHVQAPNLRSAAQQYQFIQKRLGAWIAAGRPLE